MRYVRSGLCICIRVGSIVRELREVFQVRLNFLGEVHEDENTYEEHSASISRAFQSDV